MSYEPTDSDIRLFRVFVYEATGESIPYLTARDILRNLDEDGESEADSDD